MLGFPEHISSHECTFPMSECWRVCQEYIRLCSEPWSRSNINIYIYIYIYIIYIYIYNMYIYIHTNPHTPIYTYIHMYIYMLIQFVYIYICTFICWSVRSCENEQEGALSGSCSYQHCSSRSYIGLFWVYSGLFWVYIGLFWVYVGLFWCRAPNAALQDHGWARGGEIKHLFWIDTKGDTQDIRETGYGVATISRLLKIIGFFCKRALYKRRYSAKETCNFKEPTNRSHRIYKS